MMPYPDGMNHTALDWSAEDEAADEREARVEALQRMIADALAPVADLIDMADYEGFVDDLPIEDLALTLEEMGVETRISAERQRRSELRIKRAMAGFDNAVAVLKAAP